MDVEGIYMEESSAMGKGPTDMQAGVQPQPLLVKAPEAARMLGIGQRKLWTMTNCGEIPCVRFGTAVRYSPAALREWIGRKMKGGK